MPQQLTQFAGSAKMLCRLVERHNLDPVSVYGELGIDYDDLHRCDRRLPVQDMDRVWRRVIELVDDDCFALEAPQCWRPGDLHSVGYVWLASATLRLALESLVRYIELVDQSARLTLERDGDVTVLCTDTSIGGYKDFAQLRECFFVLVVHLARLSAGENFVPARVTFRHPPRGCELRFAAWFGCPLAYHAEFDSIVFTNAALDQRLSSVIPGVAEAMEQAIVADIAKARSESVAARVRAVLTDALPRGEVDADFVASSLQTGRDALQRSLQREGTSFRTVLDELRQELVGVYIRDQRRSLNEIGFLLGFSDQSAFTRAFKRWFGTSPKKYRAAHSS